MDITSPDVSSLAAKSSETVIKYADLLNSKLLKDPNTRLEDIADRVKASCCEVLKQLDKDLKTLNPTNVKAALTQFDNSVSELNQYGIFSYEQLKDYAFSDLDLCHTQLITLSFFGAAVKAFVICLLYRMTNETYIDLKLLQINLKDVLKDIHTKLLYATEPLTGSLLATTTAGLTLALRNVQNILQKDDSERIKNALLPVKNIRQKNDFKRASTLVQSLTEASGIVKTLLVGIISEVVDSASNEVYKRSTEIIRDLIRETIKSLICRIVNSLNPTLV